MLLLILNLKDKYNIMNNIIFRNKIITTLSYYKLMFQSTRAHEQLTHPFFLSPYDFKYLNIKSGIPEFINMHFATCT